CSKAPSLHGRYPLPRYDEPGRHRLAFGRFPGVAGYTTELLHRCLDGTRTVSPVARHVRVTVLPLTTPPEWQAVSVSPQPGRLPSPHPRGLGLRSPFSSRPPLGSLTLRPGDSLTTPEGGLVGRLHPVRFLRGCDPSYRVSDGSS